MSNNHGNSNAISHTAATTSTNATRSSNVNATDSQLQLNHHQQQQQQQQQQQESLNVTTSFRSTESGRSSFSSPLALNIYNNNTTTANNSSNARGVVLLTRQPLESDTEAFLQRFIQTQVKIESF